MSPGSCFIQAIGTEQGVMAAFCEGRSNDRLNFTDDNLPAHKTTFRQLPSIESIVNKFYQILYDHERLQT